MAGNKFRTLRKENKPKFDKNKQLKLVINAKVFSKPSINEKYFTNQTLLKDTTINNIEDIIIQKDGIYAKIKSDSNNYNYIQLSNDKNEEFAKNVEDFNINNPQNPKIKYSTYGQIKLGDESLKDSTSTKEDSTLYKSHQNFLNKSFEFLKTTKFGIPTPFFKIPSSFHGIIEECKDTPFESLIKSTCEINPFNDCPLNFGQRLLEMSKFAGLKSLVNLNNTLSKFNGYDLKPKTNEQNLLQRIEKFNKECNDCDSNKVENVENMINDLFTKRTENTEDSENNVEISDEEINPFISQYLSIGRIFENEDKKIQNSFAEPNFNEREKSQEIYIYENNKKNNLNPIINNNHNIENENKTIEGKKIVTDRIDQEFEIEYKKGKVISVEQKTFKIIVVERELKTEKFDVLNRAKFYNQELGINYEDMDLALFFDYLKDKLYKLWNKKNCPHKGIIYGDKYYDFMDDGEIYCYPLNMISENEKNVNLEGYDKEHFWVFDKIKIYFKKGNPLYERDKEYFYNYKKTEFEGFTNKPIDNKIFKNFQGKYNFWSNNCNHFVQKICEHAGMKVEIRKLFRIIKDKK